MFAARGSGRFIGKLIDGDTTAWLILGGVIFLFVVIPLIVNAVKAKPDEDKPRSKRSKDFED